MKHVYTSIDIGSDTIKVVVCELFHNKLNLLAASSVKSKGIKKGLITDIYEASESVKKAINEVEEMLGIKIKKVITSIPSYYAEFNMIAGNISLEDKIITGDDISSLIQETAKTRLLPDKEMVTVIPIDFELDGIKMYDPKGNRGSLLSIRAILVQTPKKNIYSVVSLLESLGIEVVDISLGSIGDINAFRSKENSDKVGAIINIGYETTNISLYNKGIVVKSSTIGIGGKNIDNDIAYIYKISLDDASKVKENFALAHKKFASVNDVYEITNKLGENIKISQFEVSEIVMSRLEEMLVLARKEINTLTKREVDYIIITGGTSSMNNFQLVAEDILGTLPIVGKIRILGVRNNKYSSAIGNIVYFINKLRLKGKDYTMINADDMEDLATSYKGTVNSTNESMLNKVFDYFFDE